MGKIFHDIRSSIKSTFRGAAIGLAAAGAAIEMIIINDYKKIHGGKSYDYFNLLFAVFVLICIIQGVFFIFSTIRILPKGLQFVIELIGDFVCASLAILAAILVLTKCDQGIGGNCWLNSTRAPMWIELASGICCGIVFIFTALKA